MTLQPDWADVSVASTPEGAEVRLDGAVIGTTPITFEALSGSRELEVAAEGHEALGPSTARFVLGACALADDRGHAGFAGVAEALRARLWEGVRSPERTPSEGLLLLVALRPGYLGYFT